MPCIMCGKSAGFNRAILDVLSGQTLGRLCRNCELDHFGQRMEMQDRSDDGECVFCDRRGHYALPKFVATIVESEGELISTNEPEVTDATPEICEHHVDLMEQFDEETPALNAGDPDTGGALSDESA